MAKGISIRIANFKSVEEVSLELAPVTILLGPPASGKSNILEAIALLGYYHKFQEKGEYDSPASIPAIPDLLRVRNPDDMFYYGETHRRIVVEARYDSSISRLEIYYQSGQVHVVLDGRVASLYMSRPSSWVSLPPVLPARLYGFDRLRRNILEEGSKSVPRSYLAEDASNLLYILAKYKRIVLRVNEWLRSLEVGLEVKMLRNGRLVFFDYDYEVSPGLLSDAITRMLYYVAAVYSNIIYTKQHKKKVILLLEEPETHVYPYTLRLLSELVAEASKSLYVVITTHNGHLLSSLWERVSNIRTYYVYRDEKGSTRVAEIDPDKAVEHLVPSADIPSLPPSEVLEKLAKDVGGPEG